MFKCRNIVVFFIDDINCRLFEDIVYVGNEICLLLNSNFVNRFLLLVVENGRLGISFCLLNEFCFIFVWVYSFMCNDFIIV